jgi:hypothetical protein
MIPIDAPPVAERSGYIERAITRWSGVVERRGSPGRGVRGQDVAGARLCEHAPRTTNQTKPCLCRKVSGNQLVTSMTATSYGCTLPRRLR